MESCCSEKGLVHVAPFCHTFGSPSQVAGDQGPQRFKASGGRGANEQMDVLDTSFGDNSLNIACPGCQIYIGKNSFCWGHALSKASTLATEVKDVSVAV